MMSLLSKCAGFEPFNTCQSQWLCKIARIKAKGAVKLFIQIFCADEKLHRVMPKSLLLLWNCQKLLRNVYKVIAAAMMDVKSFSFYNV